MQTKITNTASFTGGTSKTVNKSADLGLIRNVVADVLGAKAKVIDYTASASAQREKALGYDAETAAYNNAANTADLYAVYTRATGDIAALQTHRQALKTIGTQQAQLAGGGFSASTGSAVDQVKSSLQESYLAEQLVRTHSRMEEGGYLEQAAAGRAQFTAAEGAKAQTLKTADVYDAAALQSTQQVANETIGLSNYLRKMAPTLKVNADDLLSGRDIGTSIALAPQIVESSNNSYGVDVSSTSHYRS